MGALGGLGLQRAMNLQVTSQKAHGSPRDAITKTGARMRLRVYGLRV